MYGEVVGFARDGQGMPASSNTSSCESVESVFAMCWKNVYGEAITSGSVSARRGSEMTYQVREIPHGVRREQPQADEVRERAGEGAKHQFVNTSAAYIPFGHGKHAWYVCIVFQQPEVCVTVP